jgi:hypothetical protein
MEHSTMRETKRGKISIIIDGIGYFFFLEQIPTNGLDPDFGLLCPHCGRKTHIVAETQNLGETVDAYTYKLACRSCERAYLYNHYVVLTEDDDDSAE